jgi:hypothetical protein
VRVAASREPAYHDIAIGDDADDIIVVCDNDVPMARIVCAASTSDALGGSVMGSRVITSSTVVCFAMTSS